MVHYNGRLLTHFGSTPCRRRFIGLHVKELFIQSFRGFSELTVRPKGHLVVMGEPGAGRSDLIEALGRVLNATTARTRETTEVDFYGRDIKKPIHITLTIGGLSAVHEQTFMDYLELWDSSQGLVVDELEAPAQVDNSAYEWVLRLAYWAEWLDTEDRVDDWVFYPKLSDPPSNSFVRARRRDIEQLGFSQLRWSGTKVLDLAPRGIFREVINNSDGGDFVSAIDQYVEEVAQAATQFGRSAQVESALKDVISPLEELLDLTDPDVSNIVKFAPETGSVSGLLRSLWPSADLGNGAGILPIWRQGSTTTSLFRVAESLASNRMAESILAIDDLGDGMDAASSAHLAATIRSSSEQVWVTTRLAAVAEVFEPQEVLRMGTDPSGKRVAVPGTRPTTKAEAAMSKHWYRNLLPALSYRSVVVVEGPNDFAALHALALRLFEEQGTPLPATSRVAIINAGVVGDGGYANVLKLAKEAKAIGLRAVGAVDGDIRNNVQGYVKQNAGFADVIVRLPDQQAIEATLVDGIPSDVLRQVIKDISEAAGLQEPPGLEIESDAQLKRLAIQFIKKYSMHGQFVDALPTGCLPVLGCLYLRKLIEVATGAQTGLFQL